MRILGILVTLLAIVFYLGRIIRFLSGNSPQTPRHRNNETIDSRLKKAKQANVIEVKTVKSDDNGKP
jgi:hypothetical protein